MSLWNRRDREAAQDRRTASLNRRTSSPPAEREDPYLSSAGDGPGVWLDDEDGDDDALV